MRLVRNTSHNGRGKYSIIENSTGIRTESIPGDADEFFVIKVKDKFARPALLAYADAVDQHARAQIDAGSIRDWTEYANEVRDLADRAGERSRFCKLPS